MIANLGFYDNIKIIFQDYNYSNLKNLQNVFEVKSHSIQITIRKWNASLWTISDCYEVNIEKTDVNKTLLDRICDIFEDEKWSYNENKIKVETQNLKFRLTISFYINSNLDIIFLWMTSNILNSLA